MINLLKFVENYDFYVYLVDQRCVSLLDGDQSFNAGVKYSPMNWFETPAVVKFEAGNISLCHSWLCHPLGSVVS